jgi:hypothetical protein
MIESRAVFHVILKKRVRETQEVLIYQSRRVSRESRALYRRKIMFVRRSASG